MEFTDIFIAVAEILGTIAFAISGATEAVKSKLDIFGVLFIGGITALGGGVMRDLFMGYTPPRMFTSFEYLLLAAATSLVVFIFSYFMKDRPIKSPEKRKALLNFIDSVGLGAFVVTGTRLPMLGGFKDNVFMCVFLGLTTGVGGGIIRDLMLMKIPAVLRRHIYAVAAIMGSIVYYYIAKDLGLISLASITCVVLIVIIRHFASKYHWNLPSIK